MQKIALIGCTGNIGLQVADVVRRHADRFCFSALVCGTDRAALARLEEEFHPRLALCSGELPADLSELFFDCDVAFIAASGFSGLRYTLAAASLGKKIALANKESLVCGGELVTALCGKTGAGLVPVDSEHSALFQALSFRRDAPFSRLILTASGGPFLHLPARKLARVTAKEALRHPTWRMGAKITIDSATLVNKGFEVIEARWLFGMPAERISVLIHPQSVVHSMVEFEDGAIKAQLGTPDMHLPIGFALLFPRRAARAAEQFSFADNPTLTFAEPDRQKYPALDMAYDCLRRGGTAACTMNGANEVAVAAFLVKRCGYLDIVRTIEHALEEATFVARPTLDDYAASDAEARRIAREFLKI